MPMAAVTSVLAAGLLPLFGADAPQTTAGSAKAWAAAYTNYCVAGGVLAQPKQLGLANDLEKAFNPELAGAGESLFFGALANFWTGLAGVGWTGAVFAPSATSISGNQSHSATPQQQAQAIAAILASITLSSVMVLVAGVSTSLSLV